MVSEDTGTERKDVPDAVEDFEVLLRDYGIKRAAVIAKNIAETGHPNVFNDPKEMAKRLAQWPRDIAPVYRQNILEHWCRQRGLTVSEELIEEVGMEKKEKEDKRKTKEAAEKEAEEKYSVDTESGAIRVATTTDKTALTWDEAEKLSKTIKKEIGESRKGKGQPKVTYVYDDVTDRVRMAREGEIGGTFEEANKLKVMAAESKTPDTESPFIMDGEGNWTLNPNARVTGIELMALESIRRAQERGEPVDPLEKLSETAEKLKTYREVFGGGTGAVGDWAKDPIKLIETFRAVSGEGKGDDTVKTELAELRKTLDDMREQRHRDEMAAIVGQIKGMQDSHDKQMQEILERVEEGRKPVSGRSEWDIMHEVIDKGTDTIREAGRDIQGALRELLSGGRLPGPKTTEQRGERKERYRKALQADQEIEQLGRSLFLRE